jgi:hypothetical protein
LLEKRVQGFEGSRIQGFFLKTLSAPLTFINKILNTLI